MPFRKNLFSTLIILLVCAVLFFLGLEKRGLWSPDETRYIAVSKEMLDTGDWTTLRRNGEIYAQKPPVFFWLISLFSVLLGNLSELSARLPSAIGGAAGVFITYLFAKRLFNERVALFSGLILATSLGYLGTSRWVILDPTLTFFVISAIYLFYLGLIEKNIRPVTYTLAFVSMAFATLTKGPVGFILPLLVIIIYAFSTKNQRALLSAWSLWGLALFISIILAWLLPACIKGGEAYTKELLLNQVFGRFFKAFDHKEPFYFYFVRFPLEFLPWTLFLPSAVIFLIKRGAKEPPIRFIFIWFAAIFLFFTFSRSKNDLYILPAYPAAAMAIAYYAEDRLSKKRWLLVSIIVAIVILNTVLTYAILPHFDAYKSPKYLSQKIAKYAGPEDRLATFNANPVYWLYYCNRRHMEELGDYDELKKYLMSRERVFCIIEYGSFEEFKRLHETEVYFLDKAPYGRNKIFALISNKI